MIAPKLVLLYISFDYCRYLGNAGKAASLFSGKWSMIRVNVAEKRLLHFLQKITGSSFAAFSYELHANISRRY